MNKKSKRRSPLDSLGTKSKGVPARRNVPVYRELTNSEIGSIPGSVRPGTSRQRKHGGKIGDSTRLLWESTPRERYPESPAERVDEILGNVRREIAHAHTGGVIPPPPIDPYIEEVGAWSGAANLIRTYAGLGRRGGAGAWDGVETITAPGLLDSDLPRDLNIALEAHFRFWLLLIIGAVEDRPALWAKALVLLANVVRQGVWAQGLTDDLEHGTMFMKWWQANVWDRPTEERETRRAFIGRVHPDVPSEKVADELTAMGLPITGRQVRNIRKELGIT